MFKYKFKIDSKIFESKSRRIGRLLRDFVTVTGKEIARFAHRTVAAYTPPTRSGRTKIRELWEMDFSRKGSVEEYIIRNTYPNKEVIEIFEYGANPHIIYPTKAPALKWIDDKTGAEVFSKISHHPGIPPYQMVAQTEKEVNILVNTYIQQTFKQIEVIEKGAG